MNTATVAHGSNAVEKGSQDFRSQILELESELSKVEGAVFGDSELCPLKHSFADGIYVREIFIPKGTVLVGKIHRHSHPNFLMKGEVVVVTEDGGREHLQAPKSIISKAGTKRAVYALQDTVWITAHATEETDLKKIEDYVIAPTYAEIETPKRSPMLSEVTVEDANCLVLALKEKGRDTSALLEIPHEGYLLPFATALAVLRQRGVSLDGVFVKKVRNGYWHASTTEGDPIANVSPDDGDLIGSWAAVGIGGATIGSSLISTYGKKKTADEPKEIKAARNLLLDYARTGQYGGFKAGEEVPLGYGDFNVTPVEQQGMSSLQGLLSSGIPQQYQMGDDALRAYLATDPTDVSAQFEPFKAKAMREIADSEKAAKRSSSFAGNLYSTDTIKKLGDVQTRGNETLLQQLAGLTDSALNRRLQAIPLAYQSGAQQENLLQNRIASAYQFGGLTRQLNDQSIKARDAELLRRRTELQMPIQAAQSVLGGPSQIPVTQSPYQDLLKMIGGIGGQYLGNKMFANQYARFSQPGTGAAAANPNTFEGMV
jgi:hypothetical protein